MNAVPQELFEEVVVDFPPAVREVWRRKEHLTVSQWARTHVYLPETITSRPGYWRPDATPYAVEVMDSWQLPWVRKLVFCAGPQTGKTLTTYLPLLYALDRQPGPAFMCMAGQDGAKKISLDYLQPILKASPKLARHLPADPDDLTAHRLKFRNGMRIYTAWVSSPLLVKTFPARYGHGDEVDDWYTSAPHLDDPEGLFDVRLRSYPHNSKLTLVSTPGLEERGIWPKLRACQVIRQWHARCPRCGTLQRLVWPRVKWPADVRDPVTLSAERLAWYECAVCEAHWDDRLRNQAVSSGGYRTVTRRALDPKHWYDPLPSVPEKVPAKPESIGFHVSALASRFVSLSKAAAEFVGANAEPNAVDRAKRLKTWTNSYPAHPWREQVKVEAGDEAAVLSARWPLAERVAPEGTVALTLGVDMQALGFWFTVWAWKRTYESALIHYGFLPTWEELWDLAHHATYAVEGQPVRLGIWRGALDTGGTRDDNRSVSRTEEAYAQLRTHGRGRVWGIKGLSVNRTGTKVRHTVLDRKKQGRGAMRGGLILMLLDSAQLKDDIYWRLGLFAAPCPSCGHEVAGHGPCPQCGGPRGAAGQVAHLHAGTGADYAAHLLGWEKRRLKTGEHEWVRVRQHDLFDASCYAHAAADPQWWGGIGRLRAPKRTTAAAEPAEPTSGQESRDGKDVNDRPKTTTRVVKPARGGFVNGWRRR